ncbi:hypothetical protein DEO72_LG2g233 [Vigna unguiculata]|uniref:RING-type domain-containing protein n=1 Tax=Vigna unguiculata TaxID=3917 RepID=A0A4D6KTV6_VIGUN|nr:hypothetical protein DEO72_LG2g233 [Vigna unguiculata]
MSPSVSCQEKGSRNKRKFRADPPLGEPSKIILAPPLECRSYEFSAEKFKITPSHGQATACDVCGVSQDHSDGLKLGLGLYSPGTSDVGPSQSKEEPKTNEISDADWSDLTEAQLEELVLSNLDTIFKSSIKTIVACGYNEEVATKAILRPGICYGCKDTVSNIVDNTLAFIRNGQEVDMSREPYFEDLVQLGKYVLAELVCVLREVRPFFSIGDAMWRLLICDMNVSHACAMDCDPVCSLGSDNTANDVSSSQPESQSKPETKVPELSLLGPSKSIPAGSHTSHPKKPFVTAFRGLSNMDSQIIVGGTSKNEGASWESDCTHKTFSAAGTSQSGLMEEKYGTARKVHSSSSRRDYILRHKTFHGEKGHRSCGSKGSSRGKANGLGGLILDKKLKPVSESSAINFRGASLQISKGMEINMTQDNINANFLSNAPTPPAFNLDSSNGVSGLTNNSYAIHAANTTPTFCYPVSLSTTNTDLSLSLSSKIKPSTEPDGSKNAAPTSFIGMPYYKFPNQWMPHDGRNEMILKLVPRVRELQNQLQEWTEWVNQKVMQATRRLSKEKAELQTLRQEKEEVERLKKEKQSLEENTLKKLSEMENALCKVSGQVERANATVQKLEMEKVALRKEMEAAKLRAIETAASCQEVSRREKKTQLKFQSWEKQKSLFQEELTIEKRKLAQLLQELEQARMQHEQVEGRWQQEEKAKRELLQQASSIRKEIEQIEESGNSKENMIKLKAERNLQRHKDDIQKLEKEISQLRLKTDSSKIAALRMGIDGSYASKCLYMKNGTTLKESQASFISELVIEHSTRGGVKRERECVMCLSEEMSVVFLPCAHQVVCTTCNELHEKQGMQDCPSCRSLIQQRIAVRFPRN